MIGLIGEKIGMSQVFSEDGNVLPVTLIKIEENVVVGKREKDKDGYEAVILGIKDLKEKKTTKPYKNIFAEGIAPKQFLKEFRTEQVSSFEIGQKLTVEELSDISYIDVTGTSKGKGFQGVVKRHGFSGGPGGHGSKFHRQNGSTGQCAYPSKVFKGTKRAGRMGSDKVTVQSLKVVKIDAENNIVFVKGAIPGKNKTIVYLKNACKK